MSKAFEKEPESLKEEVAAALRCALPLLRLSGFPETSFALCIDSAADRLAGVDGMVLGAAVDLDGTVRLDMAAVPGADAWARGTGSEWSAFLSGTDSSRLQLGGGRDLAEAWLQSLRTQAADQLAPAFG